MDATARLDFQLRRTRGEGPDSFRVEAPRVALGAGDILALTGPSGCGKSTLLEMLGLVLEPEPGSHLLWRTDPNQLPLDIIDLWRRRKETALSALRARKLGFILQSGGLVQFLNVRANIALPRRLVGLPEYGEGVDRLVETLGIGHLLAKKPGQLSIGERQRVAIARALAHEPPLLLADEPTASLDPARAETVMAMLVELVRVRCGMAVIVTHDRELIRRMGLREMCACVDDGGKTARFLDAA
jgi:putative ABC transport system ATP-binding protein